MIVYPRHGWFRVPIGSLSAGRVFSLSPHGDREIRVGEVQRWTRWDGTAMVTVITEDGRGLAARPASFEVYALCWSDAADGIAELEALLS